MMSKNRLDVSLKTGSGDPAEGSMAVARDGAGMSLLSAVHGAKVELRWSAILGGPPEAGGISRQDAGAALTVGQWLAAKELASKESEAHRDCVCHRCAELGDEVRMARNNLRAGRHSPDGVYGHERLNVTDEALSRVIKALGGEPDANEAPKAITALHKADMVLDRAGNFHNPNWHEDISQARAIIKDALREGG